MRRLIAFILACLVPSQPATFGAYYYAAASAGGAFSPDASSNGSTAGATSFSWAHTCTGSNRVLFVGVMADSGVTVTGITYNGVAMTEMWDLSTTGVVASAGYYLSNPATGSNTVEVTFSSASGGYGAGQSFTGANTASPIRSPFTATGGGGDSQATVTVTDAQTGDIVVDMAVVYQSTITIGSGQTLIGKTENLAGGGRSGGASYESSVGSTVMNWTHTNTYWVTGAVAIKPAP